MRFLGKFLIIIVAVLVSPLKVEAIAVSPSSGNYGVGSIITFNILATSVPTGAVAAQIRFTLSSGAEITSYTPPSGAGWGAVSAIHGGCNGTQFFSASQLCPDVAKGSNSITEGESLGSVVIKFNAPGTVTFTKSAGNAYLVDTSFIESTNAGSGTYNILTDLPATSIFDDVSPKITVPLLGAFLIGAGIYFFRSGKKYKEKFIN